MAANMPAPATSARERGSLTISEQAVRRLAAQALTEIDDGPAGTVLRTRAGSESHDRSTKVNARVGDGEVSLQVKMSLVYPAPIAATTEHTRRHLRHRVTQLTGMLVRRVDITVTALRTTADDVRRGE